MGDKHTMADLHQMQAMPLEAKIRMTKRRISEWVDYYRLDGVYVSFSGGKDSTVLLHIARELFPEMKAMFVNTGLEYPEIVSFVKTFDNVDIVKPKKSFPQVCAEYGFPLISKEVSDCVQGARKYLTAFIEQNHLGDRQTDRQTVESLHPYWFNRYQRLTGQGEYATERTKKQSEYLPGGGTTESIVRSEESENSRKSYLLEELLKIDPESVIDNLRIQRLMGINTFQGKVTMESIPSKKDKSMFSCERYQFFLDAPFEISNKCCQIMKKNPARDYGKKTGRVPITAQMATESRLRTQVWLKQGCNGFNSKKPISNPMSFWSEQDVLYYIYLHKIPIASVYGQVIKDYEYEGQLDMEDLGWFDMGRPTLKTTGCQRTGCVLCGFGCHIKGNTRFLDLKETHPNYHKALYGIKNSGVTYAEAIDWVNEHGNLNIKY